MPNNERKVLTRNEAVEILAPYYNSFKEVYTQSFEDVMRKVNYDIENGMTLQLPHVNATIMYQNVLNHLRNSFLDVEGFNWIQHNRIYGLLFQDALFIRVKKLDNQLNISGIRTKQSTALNCQETIPGFPARPCIITAGYRTNSMWTSLESVNFVCTNGSKILWDINLMEEVTMDHEIPFEHMGEKVSPSVQKLQLLTVKENLKRKKAINDES